MGGGNKETEVRQVEAPKQISPLDTARQTLQAQMESIPQAAQLNFDVLSNPNYGLQAQTQLQEDTRRNVFSGESDVRDQLIKNILSQLISPTGITPEQQMAVDTRRGQAQSELVKALRDRANLGGGLFGGRSARAEAQSVADLQNQFATEDISMQERNRLNTIQAALPLLQTLFPQAGIVNPSFIDPTPSGGSVFGAANNMELARASGINQKNQFNATMASQENALSTQMKMALMQELGKSARKFIPVPD